MFENFENYKKVKAPGWLMGLLVVSIGAHVAFGAGLVVKEMWAAPLLDVPPTANDLAISGPPPPPAAPPPGGKKLEVKKNIPRRVKVTEIVQPTKPDDKPQEIQVVSNEDGVEGGVEGGTEGGIEDGIVDNTPPPPPPPPQPPPPPPPPQNVAPQAFEAQRISGEKQILPDDVTKTDIQRSGKTQFIVPVKVCVATNGSISDVKILKSSGFPAYDQKLNREIRNWRYTPFMVNGIPAPACGMVNFSYRQS